MTDRSGSSPDAAYRYGYNGKENDNEVKGESNQQDYGFRVYDPRVGRFLSVDPLTASYPHYTPYQFAGNKPIAAVDLDGSEEKIVIYNHSEGKVITTTYNYQTLKKTVETSGSYAMTYSISKEEFMKYKSDFFNGFASMEKAFVSGFREYTLGMSSQNRAGYRGPGRGTLTVGAGTDGLTLQFDPTPIKKKKTESSYSIIKRNIQNPNDETKKALNSMKNYVAGISLAIAGPEILATPVSGEMTAEYIGAFSNIDQLTGNKLTSTGSPDLDRIISFVKIFAGLTSLNSSFNSIGEKSNAIPSLISGYKGVQLDAVDLIMPTLKEENK